MESVLSESNSWAVAAHLCVNGAVERGDEADEARLVLERGALVDRHRDSGARVLRLIPGVGQDPEVGAEEQRS